MNSEKEHIIRIIVKTAVTYYAAGFSDRHISEHGIDDGAINTRINNLFIATLGTDIQFYSAISHFFYDSIESMLEKMAISIAEENYKVFTVTEGVLYPEQVDFIGSLLEKYSSLEIRSPQVRDYDNILVNSSSQTFQKKHKKNYCFFDKGKNFHYLIALRGRCLLDMQEAKAEKETLLEQYLMLSNSLKTSENINLFLATTYNRYGEGNDWRQESVSRFFANDELLISRSFWNFVCKADDGYDIIIDEYKKNAYRIIEALNAIRNKYLPSTD